MKIISILIVCMLSFGCSIQRTPEVYKTEYFEVLTPVVHTIDRPDRPVYTDSDSVHTYLLKVLEYTEILEILIDEQYNKKEEVYVP